MIRRCNEEDRERLKEFLNEEPVYHTFLISDLDKYGFDKDFQTVYIQEEEGSCIGVFLKYFHNFILAGDEQKLDYGSISRLLTEEITTVMGKAEIISNVVKHTGRQVHMVYNNLYIQKETKGPEVDADSVRFADLGDAEGIFNFLMGFPELKNLYSEEKMIENRIKQGEGIHAVIEKEGVIVAHGNSAASADLTCMLGGICVKEDYRGRGYAKAIMRALCREAHRRGKLPCIFAPEGNPYSIFSELGFEIYGSWGVAQLI